MRRGSRGAVDNKRYYELLGVSQDADENELKKSYRRLAMKHHPDKGGDVEMFQEISHAFEILSDPEKRQIYDQYGEEALKEGAGAGGGFHNPQDIFEAMFGGSMFGSGGSRRRGPQKSENVSYPIKVTLQELYSGKSSKLAITRHRVCTGCSGSGSSSPEGVVTCSDCSGQGVRVQLRQVGPGMVQQLQSVCARCSGSGRFINEKYRCGTCKGAKVVKQRKVLEVFIDPGMQDGQKIVFSGEADEEPGCEPGDVIIVIKQSAHDVFERKGKNLVMNKDIPLVDALCGTKFIVEHLDGRKLVVSCSSVIKSGDIKSVAEEGMPTWKSPFDKGYLFIRFNVVFPRTVSPSQAADLQKIFGPVSRPSIAAGSEHVEEHEMVDFSPEHERGAYANGTADAMHDDDEPGGERVQCSQS
mmetsp:Transcript_5031/g.8770  ORF Transcript_5031/g.8770 Transcript_5031/m.8770 type:complete len:413 (-) Transcript_5031:1840-3078(-)